MPDFSNHFVHLNPAPLGYDHLQASNQQPMDRMKSHLTKISYYFFIVTLPVADFCVCDFDQFIQHFLNLILSMQMFWYFKMAGNEQTQIWK